MKHTTKDNSFCRSLISTALSIILAIMSLTQSVAFAQSSTTDLSPPVIELEEIPKGVAGQAQVFTALVSDNVAIRDVKLYYRLSDTGSFSDVLMTSLAGTDYYTATIETTEEETATIYYYIQARDEGGNRVVKGFAFDPFLRTLDQSTPITAPSRAPQAGVTPEPTASGGIKIWQIVLGVLAVGAIAAAAGNGNDKSGTPAPQVPLTLTINTP